MKRHGSPRGARRRHELLLPAAILSLLCACTTATQQSTPTDPRDVLQAHISHGIGESPFDSPLVSDSLAADLIVRARSCAATDLLRQRAGDTAQADRLLARLRDARLLVFSADGACTTFPIIIGAERAAYAQLTQQVAGGIQATLAADFAGLMQAVEERGWQEWQYHFLWSQLFDSQFAWTEMMQRNLVPPLGRLIAWAIYPGHSYRSGTNYYPDTELRNHWLLVSWRGGAANTVARVGANWEALYGAGVEGRELSAAQQRTLSELDLSDERGRLSIPILHDGDPLLDHLRSLALRYVTLLAQHIPLDSLAALTLADRETTFAMAYHDISWSIVEEFVRSGRIDVPAALDPAHASATSTMRGIAAIVPAYPPFVELIRAAIGIR